MNVDNLLPLVGEFGRFQKLLIIFYLCLITAVFRSFVIYNDVLLTVTPTHWCKIPQVDHLPPDTRSSDLKKMFIPAEARGGYMNKFSECFMYEMPNLNLSSSMERNYHNGINDSRSSLSRTTCKHGWTYDFSGTFYPTAASEMDLVCDKKHIVTTSHMTFWLWFQIGGPIFGFVSDRYGRIPSAVVGFTLGAVAGIATTYPFHWIFYLASRSLAGFAFSGMVAAGLTLVTEFVGPSYRTTVGFSWAGTSTLTNACIPWLAYLLRDWKKLTLLTSVPFLIVPVTARYLPESFRWLTANKKTDRAIELLQRIAKINNKTLQETDIQKMKNAIENAKETKNKTTILDLFRTPNLRKITILVTICWAGTSCLYLGQAYLSANLMDHLYISVSIGGLAEFCGCVLQFLLLDKIGRRGFSMLVLLITAVTLSSIHMVPAELQAVRLALMLTGRAMASGAFHTAFQYHAELFPTVARAQGVGVRFAIGNTGAMLAPMIASLHSTDESLPLMIFGGVGIVTCIMYVFLPETMGEELPQTLEDGERFGQDQSYFSCFRHRSYEPNIKAEKWIPTADVF